jgi:hypothetical protein
MSIIREPSEWDQQERSQRTEYFIPRKSTRGMQSVIGRGSLACPSCSVPIVSAGTIPIGSSLRCPFCREIHSARSYLRLETPDTTLNEVHVTARLR